jgi:hypothetical protein
VTQVLDQQSRTDSGQRTKASAQSGNTEESVRHLSLDELKSYCNGRLPAARLKECGAHLDACLACRAELEDLRTLQSGAIPPPAPNLNAPGLGFVPNRPRRGFTATQRALLATIFVAVIATAFFMWGRLPRGNKQPTAAPSVSTASDGATPTAAITVPPRNGKSETPASVQHGTVPPAQPVSRSPDRAPAAPGPSEANPTFALLGPFGDTVSDTRPELKWQPLAGTNYYSVRIVDLGLSPVQRNLFIKGTSWRPPRPLRPGHTYFWQVTATLRSGKKVVATPPSASAPLLRIAPSEAPDQNDADSPEEP